MSKTDTPPYVDTVDPTFTEITHGAETYECRQFDDGNLRCPKGGCRSIFDTEMGLKGHLTRSHKEDAYVERECGREGCDETFRVRSYGKEYCSQSCASLVTSEANVEVCQRCGDEFKSAPSLDQNYCSRACYAKTREHKESVECKTCGETFEAPPCRERVYCSRDCFYLDSRGDRTYE